MTERQDTIRPFEAEHSAAVEAFNEAIYAVRAAKEMEHKRRTELHAISRKFYDANPDLPVPE